MKPEANTTLEDGSQNLDTISKNSLAMKNAGDGQVDSEFQVLFSLILQNNLKILHAF